MNWFSNLSTRHKLLVAFGVMLVLLAIVAINSYLSLDASLEAQRRLFNTDLRAVSTVHRLDANNNEIRVAVLMMLTVTNQADVQQWHDTVLERSRENDRLVTELRNEHRKEASFSAELDKFEVLRTAYKETRERQVIPLVLQGRVEEARALSAGGVQNERFLRMQELSKVLVARTTEDAENIVSQSEHEMRQRVLAAIAVSLAAVIIGSFLVLVLDRLIAKPIADLVPVADRIAAGDLTGTIHTEDRRDETGSLSKAFRGMLGGLRDMNRQVGEVVNTVAASAAQILAASSEMAATASETATAVAQTTSTVEEVKQTAQVSKSKARHVADIAQRAVDASDNGRKAVDDSVSAMNRIRSQMNSVADSIVRLSEQSQSIGNIITTVNDLAEQSKLLAVNASIEAAKAGEHGLGFGVVAQEIRNLATESKQATNQVRGILGDIQKATSTAVMATEQGTKAVENGVQQTAQAGEAIRVLADSINQAAEAALQIAASSEEQSVGMDQVAQAMENIKEAAQQNANATRQSESAARSLHDSGQKLQQLVSRFKTDR